MHCTCQVFVNEGIHSSAISSSSAVTVCCPIMLQFLACFAHVKTLHGIMSQKEAFSSSASSFKLLCSSECLLSFSVRADRCHSTAIQQPFLHPASVICRLELFKVRVAARAYPSGHRVRGLYPRQVAMPSQDTHAIHIKPNVHVVGQWDQNRAHRHGDAVSANHYTTVMPISPCHKK